MIHSMHCAVCCTYTVYSILCLSLSFSINMSHTLSIYLSLSHTHTLTHSLFFSVTLTHPLILLPSLSHNRETCCISTQRLQCPSEHEVPTVRWRSSDYHGELMTASSTFYYIEMTIPSLHLFISLTYTHIRTHSPSLPPLHTHSHTHHFLPHYT